MCLPASRTARVATRLPFVNAVPRSRVQRNLPAFTARDSAFFPSLERSYYAYARSARPVAWNDSSDDGGVYAQSRESTRCTFVPAHTKRDKPPRVSVAPTWPHADADARSGDIFYSSRFVLHDTLAEAFFRLFFLKSLTAASLRPRSQTAVSPRRESIRPLVAMSTAIDAENDTGNDTKIARDAWRASPGGPFKRHAHCQSSSGEHGQTSSGENDRVVFLDDGGPGTKRARMDSDGSVKTHESAVDVLRLGAHGEAFGARTAATKTALRAGSSKRLALKKNSPGAVHKTNPGQTRRNGVPPVDIPEGRMRCSRNDGKNWRCSEMAMPGHKHCQKHMRWSAGGRSKQRGGEREGASGAKRPRWLAEEIGNAHGQTPHSFPSHLVPFPGASNPLLAAPLLNVAATALDELRHKEAVLRAMSQGVASAFGAFGGFPGATAFSGFPGPNNAGATHRPTAQKAPVSIDSLGGIAQMRSAPVADFSATECLAPVTKTHAFAPRFVECDVELVPAPAGSGRGAQNRKKIDLSLVANFDDLHVALADVVGAARPAGGRYDPSALQIAYVGTYCAFPKS